MTVVDRTGLTGLIPLASLIASAMILPLVAFAGPDPVNATGVLEEVIVTARKIPENLRDIPISIQVLTASELERAKLSALFDLQYRIPGLVLNTTGEFGGGFALRGVADQGGTSASVASHFNGVYLGSSNLALGRLFDLERIEVLKGPQGTLYGRNATGGTLNYITRAPEAGFAAAIEAAYGSFETKRAEGNINYGGNDLAARLAFIASDGEGFIRNSVDDRRFGQGDYWGIRGSVRWQPSGAMRIDLAAQRVYDDGASTELWLPNPAYLPDPNDIHLTTVTLADPFLRIRNDILSLTAEYDLGWAMLRSVSGYARSKTEDVDDCAGTPVLRSCVRGALPLEYDQWSEEIQLVSPGGERVDWLAGVYVFSGDEYRHTFQRVPDLNPLPLVDRYADQHEHARAVFGQAEWHMGGGWGLVGGVRYSVDEYDLSDVGTGVGDHHERVTARDDWAHFSWRLDLERNVRDGVLVYASVSTGFKSGGINSVVLPDGGLNRFDPEDLLAYELGLKLRSFESALTLDVSVFFYNFSNLQTNSVYLHNGRGIVEVDNAAKAEVRGLDGSIGLALGERLVVSAGMVWLPTREFVDYTISGPGIDLSGNLLSRAPEWSMLVAFDYRVPLFHLGTLEARLEYSYRSAFFFTKENNPLYEQGDYGLLNVLLRYEPVGGNWYAFASGRNLTDQDYFHQVFLQSAPGYPDTYEVGIGFRF